MTRYIVCIVTRVGSRDCKFWVRDDHTPNVAEWALRFSSDIAAYAYVDTLSIAPLSEVRLRPVVANVNHIRTVA